MKLLIPLAILALCIYYYLEMHKEQTLPVAPIAVAAPTPAPKKKFYHSPLDAPAMPTTTHSGMGYTSSNRNTNWQGSHLSDGRAARMAVPDQSPDPDDN